MDGTTTETESRFAVAERFTNALVSGDLDGIVACYDSDAKVWHNFDALTVDAHEHAQGMTSFFAAFPGRKATDIRRQATDSGIVQQYVLHLEGNDGRSFVQPICVVFTIEAGKIKRLDEYVDLSRMS